MAKQVKTNKPVTEPRAILFARVSSREQEKGMSLSAQVENIRKYCDSNNIKIIKEYSITESSTKGDRKQFREMLDFAKQQPNKIMIVADRVDRLQRSFKESIELEDLCQQDKIELIFLRENLHITKDSKTAEKMIWDFSVMASKTYIGNMRDAIIAGHNKNTRNGKWDGFAPLGYLNVRDENGKATVIIDPERYLLVKRLFEEYATGGYSLRGAETLTQEMNLCFKKNKTPIRKNQIYKILRNPFYYGVMVRKGEMYPHVHGAIIDKSLFDRVQSVLDGKKRPELKRSYGETPYAFRGLIKCGTCGCTITPEFHRKPSGREYVYLKCSHFHGNCQEQSVNENVFLEKLKNEVLSKLQLTKDEIEIIKKDIRANLEQKNLHIIQAQKHINTELNELEEKKQRLIDMYIDGGLSKDDYEFQKNKIESRKVELGTLLERHKQVDAEITENVELFAEVAGKAAEIFMSSKPSTKRQILGNLVYNCEMKGKNLLYSISKPFDSLLNQRDCLLWWTRRDSNPGPTD